MRRLRTVSIFSFMLAVFLTQEASAAYVPEQINYQGRITNTGGFPFNGTYNLTFTIYDAPVGGANLWSETHNGVAVANGLFSIILGTTTPITTSTLSTDSRWLGITLLPGPEMTPRTKITSVAYAIKSARADTADYVINGGTGDGLWSELNGNVYRAGGLVGIGLSNPTEKLHVDGNGRFEGPIKLKTSDQIEIIGDSGNTLNLGGACPVAIQTTNAASNISFMTSNVSRMHIDGNDNIWMGAKLGLGEFSPDQRLSVGGMIGIHSSPWVQPTTRGLFLYHGGTGGDVYAYDYPGGKGDPIGISGSEVKLATYAGGSLHDRLTIANAGNVGVGTSNPLDRLHVNGALRWGNDGSAPYAWSNEDETGLFIEQRGSGNWNESIRLQASKNGDLANYSTFRITPSGGFGFTTVGGGNGNVGIGTESPLTDLHVRRIAPADATIRLEALGSIAFDLQADRASGDLQISSNVAPNLMVMDGATGNVGIGVTNPNAKLKVYGGTSVAASFLNDNPSDVGVWIHNGSNTSLGIQSTNTSEFAMKIGAGDPALPQNPALYCIGYVDVNGFITATTSLSNINTITGTCSGNYSGVAGINTGTSGGHGVFGSAGGVGYAGYFAGKLCATGTIGACSDLRYKKNIYSLMGSLDKVSRLRGVTYDWKNDEFPDKNFPATNQIGLIAQEVKEVVPEVVSEDRDGYMAVDYARLTALLVEAVKELKAQNETLSKRIEALEQQPKVRTAAESTR